MQLSSGNDAYSLDFDYSKRILGLRQESMIGEKISHNLSETISGSQGPSIFGIQPADLDVSRVVTHFYAEGQKWKRSDISDQRKRSLRPLKQK